MTRTSIFQSILGKDEQQEQSAPTRPAPVYRPTYENKLRLIGHHLDAAGWRSLKLLEVPGGLLARVASSDGATEELLEFPNDTFADLFAEAVQDREPSADDYSLRVKTALIPTSYEDVLRALGATLDEWSSRSILISEGQAALFITGRRLENGSLRSVYAPFELVLGPPEVDSMLDEAYARR